MDGLCSPGSNDLYLVPVYVSAARREYADDTAMLWRLPLLPMKSRSPEDVGCWLPLYHDMGLIGMLWQHGLVPLCLLGLPPTILSAIRCMAARVQQMDTLRRT